jgi:tyrosyl-tRNA synthetase
MKRYYLLLLGEEQPDIHPMDAKKQLASRIVERYHSPEAAQAALVEFNTRFSKKDLDKTDLPAVAGADLPEDIIGVVVGAYSGGFQVSRSRSDARRLVEQGSVQVNGEKVSDPKGTVALKAGDVIRLDKTRAVRVS